MVHGCWRIHGVHSIFGPFCVAEKQIAAEGKRSGQIRHTERGDQRNIQLDPVGSGGYGKCQYFVSRSFGGHHAQCVCSGTFGFQRKNVMAANSGLCGGSFGDRSAKSAVIVESKTGIWMKCTNIDGSLSIGVV